MYSESLGTVSRSLFYDQIIRLIIIQPQHPKINYYCINPLPKRSLLLFDHSAECVIVHLTLDHYYYLFPHSAGHLH